MILIVDFGSQTAHLIGRRLRQIGVQTEYIIPEEALERVKGKTESVKKNKKSTLHASSLTINPKITGIILSGGPSSVYDKGAPTVAKDIFELGIPILGICYGWQLMAYLLGATIKNTAKEYGPEMLTIKKPIGVLKSLPTKEFSVIVSHGDTVMSLPESFENLAETRTVTYSAVADVKNNLYGVQFHPEAHHTEHGTEIFKNFAMICKETLEP